jgi:hypothetical protein
MLMRALFLQWGGKYPDDVRKQSPSRPLPGASEMRSLPRSERGHAAVSVAFRQKQSVKWKADLCRYFSLDKCRYGLSDCFFAHGNDQLQCSRFQTGACRLGDKCNRIHNQRGSRGITGGVWIPRTALLAFWLSPTQFQPGF